MSEKIPTSVSFVFLYCFAAVVVVVFMLAAVQVKELMYRLRHTRPTLFCVSYPGESSLPVRQS